MSTRAFLYYMLALASAVVAQMFNGNIAMPIVFGLMAAASRVADAIEENKPAA